MSGTAAASPEAVPAPKLAALTGARFLAASCIVIFHTFHYLGYGTALAQSLSLVQGVSFFYVLSGFILFYVYRHMESRRDARHFWVARFARVWPLHLVTLMMMVNLPYGLMVGSRRIFFMDFLVVLACFLIFVAVRWLGDCRRRQQGAGRQRWQDFLAGGWLIYLVLFVFAECLLKTANEDVLGTYLMHIALVQSWVPDTAYAYAFNTPAWSISCEAFFYLMFPLFIWHWSGRWAGRVLLAMAGLLLMLLLAGHFPPPASTGFSRVLLVYVFPLARFPEFVVGMAAAFFWLRYRRWWQRCPLLLATVFEVAALLACLACMHFCHFPGDDASPLQAWANGAGGVLAFAALIFLLASGRGAVSALLGTRPLVLLGEISFAMYMVHNILIVNFFCLSEPHCAAPTVSQLVSFWGALLLVSWLLWRFVETPSRHVIVAMHDKYRASH